jgi:hypothetical protein
MEVLIVLAVLALTAGVLTGRGSRKSSGPSASYYAAEMQLSQMKADRYNKQLEENDRSLKEWQAKQDQIFHEAHVLRQKRAEEWGTWLLEQDPANAWMVHEGKCFWGLFSIQMQRFHAHLITGDGPMYLPPHQMPDRVPGLAELQMQYYTAIREREANAVQVDNSNAATQLPTS